PRCAVGRPPPGGTGRPRAPRPPPGGARAPPPPADRARPRDPPCSPAAKSVSHDLHPPSGGCPHELRIVVRVGEIVNRSGCRFADSPSSRPLLFDLDRANSHGLASRFRATWPLPELDTPGYVDRRGAQRW